MPQHSCQALSVAEAARYKIMLDVQLDLAAVGGQTIRFTPLDASWKFVQTARPANSLELRFFVSVV
jgi:hypothetical protein